VKASGGDGQHHLSPAIRELWKSVKEQNARTTLDLEACLKDVHPETVDIIDEP
jgi:hypothetical protein